MKPRLQEEAPEQPERKARLSETWAASVSEPIARLTLRPDRCQWMGLGVVE